MDQPIELSIRRHCQKRQKICSDENDPEPQSIILTFEDLLSEWQKFLQHSAIFMVNKKRCKLF